MRLDKGFFITLTLSFAVACSGDEAPSELSYQEACERVPGCANPRYDVSQPKETILRVLLLREPNGAVRVDEVAEIEVFEGKGVPLGSLGGTHLLVGLDAQDIPIDGQVISFPEELEVSRVDAFEHEHLELANETVSVVGYVRKAPNIESIGVVDSTGALIVETPAQATTSTANASDAGIGSSEQPLTQASGNCAHVRLLEGEADRAFAQGMSNYDTTEIIVPGPTQRAVIDGALSLMEPVLCHSISRIAVGRIDGNMSTGGVVAQLRGGDFILMNDNAGYSEAELAASEEARLRMISTIIHEAGHTLESALNAQGVTSQSFEGDWPLASRTVAANTVDHVRVRVGLLNEWQRTHLSFVEQGFALPWGSTEGQILAIRAWDAKKTAESGFMSRYGATNYAEDIAEIVAWTYMGRLFEQAGIAEGPRQKEDFGCQMMQQHSERSVPGGLADIYTKLMFIKDLGATHPDDVAWCTGDNLGLQLDSPGFHIYQEATLLSSFERALTASIGTRTDNGALVFDMNGQGEASFGDERYPATFHLQLDLTQSAEELTQQYKDNPPWPRGIYPLALTAANQFELRLDGAPSGNFDVSDGFVLVAEASNDRIAGSVFIRKVWRLNAPIPVPEVYDPPLAVRFLIEN